MIVNFVWTLAFKLSAFLVIQLGIFGYGAKAKFPIDDSMMRAIQGTLGCVWRWAAFHWLERQF
jgi:hypothetical protein